MIVAVDVCMITYNQALFVKQAISSVLEQTYSNWHLIICDDHSTDGTVEICKEFQNNFPDKISFYPNPVNVGMISNFIRCLKTSTSQYIAICEGDDQWTDPEKLQLQIDFLETHPDYVLSFHNADVINSDGSLIIRKFNHYVKDTFQGEDLLRQWLMPTASVVFRNLLNNPLPLYFINSTHGDLALFLFLAQYGKIGYIDRTMSLYRKNEQSVTMARFKGKAHHEKHIVQCREMLTFFKPRYKKLLQTRIAEDLCSLAYLYAREGNSEKALLCLRQAITSDWLVCLKRIKYFAGTIILLLKHI
jgi:glycosyltransferase involved in cell wall biosynthesis